MKGKVAKKASPLLLLVILTIASLGVGAILLDLFVSQDIGTSIEVRGVDASVLEGNVAGYLAHTEATELVYYASLTPDPPLGAILVLNDHTMVDEDMILEISAYESDGITELTNDWSVACRFTIFKPDGTVSWNTILVESAPGVFDIPNNVAPEGSFHHMIWDPAPVSDRNGIYMNFDITPLEYATEDNGLDYSSDIDAVIVCTLQVDDGT